MRSLGIQGLLKRALPFIATFGVALLVTSFFVDIHLPRFGRSGRHRHQECQQVRADYERMKAEVERMRAEMEAYDQMRHPGQELELDIPVPPMPPLAPVAPHSHK